MNTAKQNPRNTAQTNNVHIIWVHVNITWTFCMLVEIKAGLDISYNGHNVETLFPGKNYQFALCWFYPANAK